MSICAMAGLIGLMLGLGLKTKTMSNSNAEETATDKYINELAYVCGTAKYNYEKNEIAKMVAGQAFEYKVPANTNVIGQYTHNGYAESHWAGWMNFHLHAKDEDNNLVLEEEGYHVSWRGDGTPNFTRNGTAVAVSYDNSMPVYQWGGSFKVEFSSVLQAVDSLLITFKINDNTIFTYEDTDPLTGDRYCASTDQHDVTVTGSGEVVCPTISLSDASKPYPSSSAAGTVISADGTVTTVAGFSAATRCFQATGSYAYKLKVEPLEVGAQIDFSIGGKDNSYPGSENSGYTVSWDRWGPLTLKKGDTAVSSIIGPQISMDTFIIVLSMYEFDNDTTIVSFTMNDTVSLIYCDDNNPIQTPKGPGTPGSLFTYVSFGSNWCYTKFHVINDATYTNKTALTNDLGKPTALTSSDSITRNGEFIDGTGVVSYSTDIADTMVSFVTRFSSLVHPQTLDLMLNYKGTKDKVSGSGWTQKGYAIRFYPGGQIAFFKKGVLLCEGWPTEGFVFSTNADFNIKFGTYHLASGAIKVVCYVGTSCVLNFIDTVDCIGDSGVFAFDMNGCTGSVKASGVTMPVLVSPEQIDINVGEKLSYENPHEGDTVQYFINTSASTATASITGDTVTATTTGSLVVYCCVNGLYSEENTITCVAPSALFDNLPTSVDYSDETFTASAVMSDGRDIESVEYSLLEGDTIASIDSDSGVVTLSGVGEIQISATITDTNDHEFTTSEDIGIVQIIPEITLDDTSKVKVGFDKELSASIDAPIPEGDVFTYEITEGDDCATLNGNILTGVSAGSVTIKVTFAKEKSYTTYKTYTLSVVGAVITSVPDAPIIVGNPDGTIVAELTDGTDATTIKYYVENVTGSATIDEDSGVIHYISAGTVKVYAVVDGITTDKTTLVLNPQVHIKNAIGMAVGAERYLGYEANCDLPDETITTTYELIEGEDLVTFDASTGYVKANAIGIFKVRVTVVGQTFSAISPTVSIAIENPIVSFTEDPKDMIENSSQEIKATLGNEEILEENKTIIITSGETLVEVSDMTITAIGAGTVTFVVRINGFQSLEKEIVISPFAVTLNVGEVMVVNDSQKLSYITNNDDYIPTSVVYSVDNNDLASIEDDELLSKDKVGTVTVTVTIDGKYSDSVEVSIIERIILVGLNAGATYCDTDGDIELSYLDILEEEHTTVVYSVVSGPADVINDTSSQTAVLRIKGNGPISVRVTVDGMESQIITIQGHINQQSSSSSEPISSSSEPISSSSEPISSSSKPISSSSEPISSSSEPISSSAEPISSSSEPISSSSEPVSSSAEPISSSSEPVSSSSEPVSSSAEPISSSSEPVSSSAEPVSSSAEPTSSSSADPKPTPSSLSGGAVAAIVISSIVGVGALSAVGITLIKKRNK